MIFVLAIVVVFACSVFPFKEGDKCCREADAKGTAKIFDKGMGTEIEIIWTSTGHVNGMVSNYASFDLLCFA